MAADPLIILDTGPLVALLDRRDQHHAWAVNAANSLHYPFLTTESVISEAVFLLQQSAIAMKALLELLEGSLIRLAFDAGAHTTHLLALLRRYADQPMSLADATIVRFSELHTPVRVFTTDTHFRIYRRNGRQAIPLLAPWLPA